MSISAPACISSRLTFKSYSSSHKSSQTCRPNLYSEPLIFNSTGCIDLVDVIIKAAKKGIPGEVYNIGSGKETSINSVANIIGGKKIYIPKRPGEPKRSLADISKIKKDLNWKPQITIEEGIKDLLSKIQYWKNAPVWTPKGIKKATKIWFKLLSK